jgi:hypothetical protein
MAAAPAAAAARSHKKRKGRSPNGRSSTRRKGSSPNRKSPQYGGKRKSHKH